MKEPLHTYMSDLQFIPRDYNRFMFETESNRTAESRNKMHDKNVMYDIVWIYQLINMLYALSTRLHNGEYLI